MSSTGQASGRPAPNLASLLARAAAALASRPALLAAIVALGSVIALWLAIDPLARPTSDPDASASVLYFSRIVGGQRLEAFWPTTPKPLLTLIYGLSWWLTHDWRSLAIVTIVAGGLAVGLAARFAARMGGAGAAVLVIVGLLAWPDFRISVAGANSFIWGLALWFLAGVLITADRPRPWLAGATLAAALLVRTETVWLLAAAGACAAFVVVRGVMASRSGPRTGSLPGPRPRPDLSALRMILPLFLGAVGLPLACLHDWLLTGRPLYWLSVPVGYTTLTIPGLGSADPARYLRTEIAHYLPAWPLVFVAALGIVWLAVSGRRAIALTLLTMGAGVLGTLVVLAWRAVYISPRYYEESDALLLLSAAIGGGVAITWIVRRAGARVAAEQPEWRRPAVSAAIALFVAVGGVFVAVPQDDATSSLNTATSLEAAFQAADPRIPAIVVGADGATMTVSGVAYPVTDPRAARIYVPRGLAARLSIETGERATAFAFSRDAFRDLDYAAVLRPGQWVLHIAAADGLGGIYAPFEISSPATMAGSGGSTLRLVPVIADPVKGVWLIRVEAG